MNEFQRIFFNLTGASSPPTILVIPSTPHLHPDTAVVVDTVVVDAVVEAEVVVEAVVPEAVVEAVDVVVPDAVVVAAVVVVVVSVDVTPVRPVARLTATDAPRVTRNRVTGSTPAPS